MRDGSFQVFLRLTQDVAGWWAEIRLAGPNGGGHVAAKVIGRRGRHAARAERRRRDSTTSTMAMTRRASTRRASPTSARSIPADSVTDPTHRLLRRGIPFGPLEPTRTRPEKQDVERGLLLNAFMASIDDQFGSVSGQATPGLPVPGPGPSRAHGPDPVDRRQPDPCRLRREGGRSRRLDLRRFVHTSGAVYAFAPSLRTLDARLADDESMGSGDPEAG